MGPWIWARWGIVVAALAMALGMSSDGDAQSNGSRTTLQRATELVDTYIARAGREKDPDMRQRMLIEGYTALLSLPIERDLRDTAKRLLEISDGLGHFGKDRGLLDEWQWEAVRLFERYFEPERVYRLLHILIDDAHYFERARRDYEFQRLVDADAREALIDFLSRDEDGKSVGRIKDLCRENRYDLAGFAALKWTDPTWADSRADILGQLGLTRPAETVARESLAADGRKKRAGIEMLTRLAATESRRGDTASVQRLARAVLDDPDTRFVAKSLGLNVSRGPCDSKLWNEWPEWRRRSVGVASSSGLRGEPGPVREISVGAHLGEAIAGAGNAPGSLELIDRLIALQDRDNAENAVDPVNLALLSRLPEGMTDDERMNLVIQYYDQRHVYRESKESLLLSRFVAGGALDDSLAKVATADAVKQSLWDYPHSPIAQRILSLSDRDRERIRRVSANLEPMLRFNALVWEGRGREARSLSAEHPGLRLEFHSDRPLLRLVGVLLNAEMNHQAAAMLDAYLEVEPGPDTIAVHFLLMQGRIDRTKAMLRDFLSQGSEVFVSIMLLRELEPTLDVSKLEITPRFGEAWEKIENWLSVMDALAWTGSSDEIDLWRRNPPMEFASLDEGQRACVQDTATGLEAVALARRGDLEAGLRLVVDRDLKQRGYCLAGREVGGAWRFDYADRPFFDLRYLVQEWVRRGHAVL